MLINKQGKMIANNTQPVKSFDTFAEYAAWYNGLPNPTQDLKKFIIIKKYELAENSYIETNTETTLVNLPTAQKKENCLYGVKDTNNLYRYDSASDSFIKMGGGAATKYSHDAIVFGGVDNSIVFRVKFISSSGAANNISELKEKMLAAMADGYSNMPVFGSHEGRPLIHMDSSLDVYALTDMGLVRAFNYDDFYTMFIPNYFHDEAIEI